MASEDCAAIKVKLDVMRAAYERLAVGGAPRVVVDSDGSRIEYTAASAGRLRQEVQLLQAQYDRCLNGHKLAVVTKPVTFIFG